MNQLIYKGLQDSSHKLYKSGDTAQDNLVYCDWPGERLFENVHFEINGNKLDEYNEYTHVFNRQFKLKQDVMEGYRKSVGHKSHIDGRGVCTGQQLRYKKEFEDSLQVPKKQHPKWQLW